MCLASHPFGWGCSEIGGIFGLGLRGGPEMPLYGP
nr:MAG TPA: hypothetical protein [Caudoviricetes sp.]